MHACSEIIQQLLNHDFNALRPIRQMISQRQKILVDLARNGQESTRDDVLLEKGQNFVVKQHVGIGHEAYRPTLN